MLKLKNIKKDYVIKGLEPVHALKGVTVNFRRNEFVAILGHSGCGKTTLLNIIGGLDRYSDGDLIIEGKSTKDYVDGDWDTYRNHSIGFVFQSYNLIQHSSVLANVELALTIAGVSKKERRMRAENALEKVGLKGLGNKKPNQLSGGQMQRVAIARALVNNPEILLADEPTGALDSETSIQIMDLLKEVASDRLVIMVTHNPDLAYQYASRIIKMSDGVLTDDSNPYKGESEQERNAIVTEKINKGNKRNSSMSFTTAFGLSGHNLLSKLKRTILVAIAGSIGIIGVTSVLSVSTGVNNYIDSMQDDMLSSYPLSIAEEAVDYTSLMAGLSDLSSAKDIPIDLNNQIGVDSMIAYLMDKYTDFTDVKTNEINDDLLEFIADMDTSYAASINYKYNIDPTNNIFTTWRRDKNVDYASYSLNGLTRMYIAELETVKGFSNYARYVDLFTNFMKQLPTDKEYCENQYDVLAGSFPANQDEMLLVVDNNTTATDILLAQLGFFEEAEFLNIARCGVWESEHKDASKEEKEAYRKAHSYPNKFNYDQVLGKSFTYYPHDDIYEYGTVKSTIIPNITITLVDGEGNPTNYTVTYDANKDILTGNIQGISVSLEREGKKDTTKNAWVGTWGVSMGETSLKLRLTDEAIMGKYKAYVSLNGAEEQMTFYTEEDVSQVLTGYYYPSKASSAWQNGRTMKISGIVRPKSNIKFGCLTRGLYYSKELTLQYMDNGQTSRIVNGFTKDNIPIDGMKAYITKEKKEVFPAYVKFEYTSFADGDDKPKPHCTDAANCLNGDLTTSLTSLIGGGGSGYTDTNIAYLRSVAGLATKTSKGIDDETIYNFKNAPKEIEFYPHNFNDKDKITDYLKTWNKAGDITLKSGRVIHFDDRNEVTVTDTISVIIAVIDTLILGVTIALVAFTSLSLVVSCFMIAVITYISTMERVKEIGVIRSLGGRKKDVSRLFIAECLITGLSSGLIGVTFTFFLTLILNAISAPLGIPQIAILTAVITISMIALSVLLNVLSGLIPSMKASRQDPVTALRSE